MIDTSLFPYQNFPYRLEFGEKKDLTVCYFECDEHLQKYLTRYKIDKRKAKILNRDEKPIKSSKTDKNKIRSGTGKTSNRGATSTGRNTKNVDTSRNTGGTRKSTAKSTVKPKAKTTAKPKVKRKPKNES